MWDVRIGDRIHPSLCEARSAQCMSSSYPDLPSGTVPSVGAPQLYPEEVWPCSPKSLLGFMLFGAVFYWRPLWRSCMQHTEKIMWKCRTVPLKPMTLLPGCFFSIPCIFLLKLITNLIHPRQNLFVQGSTNTCCQVSHSSYIYLRLH